MTMEQATEKEKERRKKVAAGVVSVLASLLLFAAIAGGVAGTIYVLNYDLHTAYTKLDTVCITFQHKTADQPAKKWCASQILRAINPSAHRPETKMTIGQALDDYLNVPAGLVTQISRKIIDDFLGAQGRVIARVGLWLFFALMFMAFFRVFTFMGYFRSMRAALFSGAVLYALLPNPTGRIWDEVLFLAIATALIVIRAAYVQRKRRRRKAKEAGGPSDKEQGPPRPPGPDSGHGPEADILLRPHEESA